MSPISIDMIGVAAFFLLILAPMLYLTYIGHRQEAHTPPALREDPEEDQHDTE